MNALSRFLTITLLSLYLSSCSFGAQELGSPESSPKSEWSYPIGVLSSKEHVSRPNDEMISSATPSISNEEASSLPLPSSSEEKAFCTVSIFQSYKTDDGVIYKEPRFDLSLTYEAGQVLYETVDEKHALGNLLHPVYHPTGGTWGLAYFCFDVKCTEWIAYGFAVNEDISIYYFCYGGY